MAAEGNPHKAMALLSVQTDASVAGLLGVGTASKEAFACIVDIIMNVAPEIILQILVNVVRQPFADIMSLIMPLIIPPIMVPNSGSVPLMAPGPDVAMFPKQAGPGPKKPPPCSCPQGPVGNPALSGAQRFAGVSMGRTQDGKPCQCSAEAPSQPLGGSNARNMPGVDGGASLAPEYHTPQQEVYEYDKYTGRSGSLPATLLQASSKSTSSIRASSGSAAAAGASSSSSSGAKLAPEAGDPVTDIEIRVVDEISQSLKGGALLSSARVAADKLERLLPAAAAAGVTRNVLKKAVPRAVQRLVAAALPGLTSRLSLSLTR